MAARLARIMGGTKGGLAAVLLLAVALFPACLPPPPPVGSYVAVSCWPGIGTQNYNGWQQVNLYGSYHFSADCTPYTGDPNYDSHGLGVIFPFQSPYNAQGHWQIGAPAGTNFVSVQAAVRRFNDNGWVSDILAIDDHGGEFSLGAGPADGVWRTSNEFSSGAPFRGLDLKMTCQASSCIGAYTPYIFGRQFRFVVNDVTPPSVSGFDWSLIGPQTATISASDQGGGVARTYLKVNGTNTATYANGCDLVPGPGISPSGTVANTLSPCPSSVSNTSAVNTAAPPFHSGNNSVRACVDDYADTASGYVGHSACTDPVTVSVPSSGSSTVQASDQCAVTSRQVKCKM